MKKLFLIFFFLFLTTIGAFSKSFYIDGKKINTIDFSGYEHIAPFAVQETFTPLGIEVQDALIQTQKDIFYNSYFAVGYMPALNKGLTWTKTDFVVLRDSLNKQLPQMMADVQSLKKLYKDFNLELNDILEPKTLVNNDACISFSTIVSLEMLPFPAIGFISYVLINEKIVMINHYDDLHDLSDYEAAEKRYIKFLNGFMVANGKAPVLANSSKGVPPPKGLGKNIEIQDALNDVLDKFLNKELLTYSSRENPDKNGGISFVLKFPKGYRQEDGIRPETLRAFTSPPDKNGFEVALNVQVAKLPDESIFLTDQEIADALFSDISEKDMTTTNEAEILYSKMTKYEGQPGHFMVTLAQIERGGMTLNCLYGAQQLIYKGHIISLNTAYYGFYRQAQFEELRKRFEEFFLFCVNVNNHFILNKY